MWFSLSLFCLHVSWYLFKFILAISLDLCHDFWSYTFCHGNHIIPVPPPPRPHPRPLSFVWLAWIKVPMMHGATTSTVSSASTPVTNVPFAESAASNQVCSFISVLFYFSSGGSESEFIYYVHISSVLTFQSVVMCANENRIYFEKNLRIGSCFHLNVLVWWRTTVPLSLLYNLWTYAACGLASVTTLLSFKSVSFSF